MADGKARPHTQLKFKGDLNCLSHTELQTFAAQLSCLGYLKYRPLMTQSVFIQIPTMFLFSVIKSCEIYCPPVTSQAKSPH